MKAYWHGSDLSWEENQQRKQWRYEESVVKHVLKKCSMEDISRRLWRLQKDLTGFGRAAFDDFQSATNFPIWLGCHRIPYAHKLSLPDLFRNFSRTRIWKTFLDTYHSLPPELKPIPVGLVFPAPGVKFMVLHTGQTKPRHGATRIIKPIGQSSRPLILEKLDDLLAEMRSLGVIRKNDQ